jgi:uncharacterized protein
MSPAPADQVNAKELAGRAASVRRSLELRQLPRVAEAGGFEGTRVDAELRFATFEGRVTVDVHVEGVVVLACQRCLKPCDCALDEREQLVVVPADGDEVPGGYEPVIGDAEHLSLAELIEEQVLLGLPLVPMHEDAAQCGATARAKKAAVAVVAAAEEVETQTPFANLRELLDKGEH